MMSREVLFGTLTGRPVFPLSVPSKSAVEQCACTTKKERMNRDNGLVEQFLVIFCARESHKLYVSDAVLAAIDTRHREKRRPLLGRTRSPVQKEN